MLKHENYTSEHIAALRASTGADPSIRRLTAGNQLQVIAVGKVWDKVVDLTTGRTGYVANDCMAR